MLEKKRILLVEDDDAIRDLCEEVLRDAGYEVSTAWHGKAAYELLKESSYDLVVTDINMPELDGIGLYLNAMKEFGYLRDRFLFMTGGMTDDADLRSVLKSIKSKCLIKPFRIKDLLSNVAFLTSSIRAAS